MQRVEAHAPGRVNLIGEHTDYNDGFVMPAAIPYATEVEATKRDDRFVNARSDRFEKVVSFDLASLSDGAAAPADGQAKHDWGDYVRGICIEVARADVALSGADLLVGSNLPLGAGLASSASLCIAIALALLGLAGVSRYPVKDPSRKASIDDAPLAELAQRVEAEYAGAQVGIMDPWIILNARERTAALLDTRTLESRYLPLPKGTSLVICNTMVKHELASSAYNERRAQCAEGAAILGVGALRDADLAMLEANRDRLPPTIYRRCRHVITENQRVLAAAAALESGDPARFGSLMYASHESLRDDYEVSCHELDAMVSIARRFAGLYGARMTGGGFGGCTVNLVATERAEAFRAFVAMEYDHQFGKTPDIYDGTPSHGAQIVGR